MSTHHQQDTHEQHPAPGRFVTATPGAPVTLDALPVADCLAAVDPSCAVVGLPGVGKSTVEGGESQPWA